MKSGEHEHRCTECPRVWIVGVCEHERCVSDCRQFFGNHFAPICGKRTARFVCTLNAGHKGAHGRAYRRQGPDAQVTAAAQAEVR